MVQALNCSSEVRQEAWANGHTLMTKSVYDYSDRKKELRAEKFCKKAAEAKVGVNELIDLAGQIDVTGSPRDIEELIGENKKQAATLDSIADETGEMELIKEMAVLKARLHLPRSSASNVMRCWIKASQNRHLVRRSLKSSQSQVQVTGMLISHRA